MDFDMLGLAPRLIAALAEQGISEPTPIQTQAIPHAMNGRDVMGLAQTGSGKTAAFGLPMIDALIKDGGKPPLKGAKALVLAPTRELARQIADTLEAYTTGTHLKVALVVGGAGITGQIRRMEKGVALLVATPGRLIDLLDRKAVTLSETRFLVLDEADQMLDMGFIHALRRIAPLLPVEKQTMLFSATMPKQMEELAGAFLRDPVRVQVNPPGQAVKRIEQSVHFVAQRAKGDLLDRTSGQAPGRAGAGLWPDQARDGETVQGAGGQGLCGGLDPRQQEPGPAGPGDHRLQGRARAGAGGDRRGSARARHPGREARL
jgi:ATP-dependent RNA helicase RhlE